MKRTVSLLSVAIVGLLSVAAAHGQGASVNADAAERAELWEHLSTASELVDARNISAKFDDSGDRRVLKLDASGLGSRSGIAWIAIPPPAGGWKLGHAKSIQASVTNSGPKPTLTTLWVVASNGWAAVGGAGTLEADETKTLSCNLREAYPDGTPKLDPSKITQVRIMVQRVSTASLAVSKLVAAGTAGDWVRPPGRLDVPDMVIGKPAAGQRVRYQLSTDAGNEVYSALYLPVGWEPGKRYPVIAEFPGNIFYNASKCWSTGRPDQCAMGYGIGSKVDVIWVSLPFVDRKTGQIAESGFGSNEGEDTTSHALAVIDDICANWGGDRKRLFLSGFSRGAIACGYIGLRNDTIAKRWKGFIACQHYDGSAWRQSNIKDAVERAPRFSGKAIFQVDNMQEKYQPVVDATNPKAEWTWTKSGLGYHATAMFLDDRPVMKQLRQWFRSLVIAPQ